jgi:hypothetical protein
MGIESSSNQSEFRPDAAIVPSEGVVVPYESAAADTLRVSDPLISEPTFHDAIGRDPVTQ